MMIEEGIQFQAAATAGRPPTLTDMWEDTVPWGQMAITALKVRYLIGCTFLHMVVCQRVCQRVACAWLQHVRALAAAWRGGRVSFG